MTAPVFIGRARRADRDLGATHSANIFRRGYDFESAAAPGSYEPHKIAARIALDTQYALPGVLA